MAQVNKSSTRVPVAKPLDPCSEGIGSEAHARSKASASRRPERPEPKVSLGFFFSLPLWDLIYRTLQKIMELFLDMPDQGDMLFACRPPESRQRNRISTNRDEARGRDDEVHIAIDERIAFLWQR